MEVKVNHLTPGMLLEKDVLGKSGNPIVEKNTKLTETHIEFIKHFLIDKVTVATSRIQSSTSDNEQRFLSIHGNQLFIEEFEQAVFHYEKLFISWQNNVPVNMYKIREFCIPLFEKTIDQNMETFLLLFANSEQNSFFQNGIAKSIISVYLSYKLGFEKKDWLQIGLAALMSDCGKATLEPSVFKSKLPNSTWQKYPVFSYKMIENEPTLTQQAKIAILQHHEYLDGSGFPAKSKGHKVKMYARIIAVSNMFTTVYSTSQKEIISVLEDYRINKLDKLVVDTLVNELQGFIE